MALPKPIFVYMKNQTTHILYVHGLNSDAQSRKYKILQSRLEDYCTIECLEWHNEDAIDRLLKEASINLLRYTNVVIIGDSTGGNFAYQLRDLLIPHPVRTKLILLNPLLDISKRKSKIPFPIPLVNYLQEIKSPKNAFIIISEQDEIIDHSWLKEPELLDTVLYKVDDTHRMPLFLSYICIIDKVLNIVER